MFNGIIKGRKNNDKRSGIVYYTRTNQILFLRYTGKKKKFILIDEIDSDGTLVYKVKVPKSRLRKPLSKMKTDDMKSLYYEMPLLNMRYSL